MKRITRQRWRLRLENFPHRNQPTGLVQLFKLAPLFKFFTFCSHWRFHPLEYPTTNAIRPNTANTGHDQGIPAYKKNIMTGGVLFSVRSLISPPSKSEAWCKQSSAATWCLRYSSFTPHRSYLICALCCPFKIRFQTRYSWSACQAHIPTHAGISLFLKLEPCSTGRDTSDASCDNSLPALNCRIPR